MTGEVDPSDISVIVPVHHGGSAFSRCVEALRQLDPSPGEVIVVIDGDDNGEAVIAQLASARIVRTERRGGPARARNLGAAAAAGSVLFFVDADVTVPSSAVGTVVERLNSLPDVSALIGSYDDDPAEVNTLSQYKNLLHHYVHQHAQAEGFTFWGACGVIRRQAFETVAGFDETFTAPSIEDIELGYRLRAGGYRIQVCKELQVKHLKRWEPLGLFQTDVLRRALPWSMLILRSGSLEDDLNIDVAARVKVTAALVGVLALLGSPFRSSARRLAAAAVLVLTVGDRGLMRFFAQRRGVRFTVAAMIWHWFSYCYSGLAFMVAVVKHLGARRTKRPSANR